MTSVFWLPKCLFVLVLCYLCVSTCFECSIGLKWEMASTRSHSGKVNSTQSKPVHHRNNTEHNYVNNNLEDNLESDEPVHIARCKGCEKNWTTKNDWIYCDFCESWFCTSCANLKKNIYQVLTSSPSDIIWFCQHCLYAFLGIKKVTIKIGTIESKIDQIIERVQKLEQTPTPEKNIQDIVQNEVREIRDQENRKLNIVCFNLPESNENEATVRQHEDLLSTQNIIDKHMNLAGEKIKVKNPVRLGKKNAKGFRPLKFQVEDLEQKRKILKGNHYLKSCHETDVQKIFTIPDQTVREREEAKKLRNELHFEMFLKKTTVRLADGVLSLKGKEMMTQMDLYKQAKGVHQVSAVRPVPNVQSFQSNQNTDLHISDSSDEDSISNFFISWQ